MTQLRTAVVTGAGSGIGKAVAIGLLQHDYRVALVGRRRDALEATAAAAGEAGARALIAPADVSDPASVQTLFTLVAAEFGRLDVLFNNAGAGSFATSIEDVSFEQWQRLIDVNVTGVFLCTQEAFRIMKTQDPRGGRIINNGSISGQVPRPLSAPYTASKHAVTGLTKSTALDGRRYDIACSQIDLGNAATEMVSAMATGVMQANGELGIEPLMELEHVVKAVVYMADLPLNANVQFMTLMATKMPFIGRG